MISHATRWKYAFRAFFSLIVHGRIARDILDAVGSAAREPAPAAPPVPAASSADAASDRAVQVLALLQRDGRLVDFLMEDLAGYADEQVGAAVRDVHAGCRESLSRYFTFAPIVAEDEGRPATIARGTDPARVKVVGNVTGTPPLRGIVRHRGWDATRVQLPPLPVAGRTIVAPAEVEVS
jgi:hypothetical protein